MHPLLNIFFFIASASMSAIAASRSIEKSPFPVPGWLASNFIWGCSPGGCTARFNLTAPENYYPGALGFDVLCSPVFIQQLWLPCVQPNGSSLPTDLRVETIWTDGPDRDKMYIGASNTYTSADGILLNATSRVELNRAFEMEDFVFDVTSPGDPLGGNNGTYK